MEDRSSRVVRSLWIAAASICAVLALGLAMTRVTASAIVCGACHEMSPKVAAWRTGGHTQIGCPACHETPLPWYRFPETLAVRGAMLTRDVGDHWSNRARDASRASNDDTSTVPDSTCLKCHDPSRKITMRFGTLIDHTEHAKRNKSCVSCHIWTAHPDPNVERPILLMAQCFTCHGRTKTAKAPGTCDVCHPKSFSLRPESHRPASAWRTRHGKVALAGGQPCDMCHDEDFCRNCHGVDMPHPTGWGKGQPAGHASVAELNRQVCARCHKEKPDLCSMCHHKGWEPTKGPWISQHPLMVRQHGAAFCMRCHAATFCTDCHISRLGISPIAQQ